MQETGPMSRSFTWVDNSLVEFSLPLLRSGVLKQARPLNIFKGFSLVTGS